MLVDSSNSTAASAVTGAISQAAQVTGTSFQYLLATAKVESGLNPQAGASTSSARGLFQFVEQTWLGTMKQAGAGLGYGKYADAITKTASGRYEVSDPALRNEILKLRNDPTVNAVMAGAFTQANAAILQDRLGRAPSEGELYVAHFLGAGGAARLLTMASDTPQGKAATYFPDAAQANPSIFYERSGAPRSLAQVRDTLTARYDVAARIRPGDTPAVAQAVPGTNVAVAYAAPVARSVSAPPTVPDTAGVTSAFAAATPQLAERDPQVFHDLFQDSGRKGPVADVVSQLWGAAGHPAPAAGSGLDLFKDNGKQNLPG